MAVHRHITKIITVLMALAVCLCLCAAVFSDQLTSLAGEKGITMEYETALFDTSEIIQVDILMDEADWEDMLANATAEEYYQCNVRINGTTFYSVGIRPKGNTSLTTIASDPDTDRYSFKLEFDHYVDGQTCFGLDKLVLNNNYADATSMKEALIYDMYQYLGADASLYNYAKISVNGEYWGVYLALEAVEDSFLLRNYGAQSGELYKPDSMNIGGFDAENMDLGDMASGDFSPASMPGGMPGGARSLSADTDGAGSAAAGTDDTDGASRGGRQFPDADSFDFSEGGFSMGGMGGFSMGGGGSDLNYTDDDPDSYSTIWEGEVTDTSNADHQRVVTALKNISEGTQLDSYMDIDNLLRYMAVHIFSVNEDSLSGMMAHNYYLYESDGQLNIIPWDYNLALGGMSGGSASSVVNEAIDNAFSGTDFFDTLMEDEEYHAQYYALMEQLVEEYISGGGFESFYSRVRSQIDALVETDPTAFYSYEEYLEAVETFYEVVTLRGESIRGQLDGTIPSTSAEQSGSDALIDASHIELSVMGSMNTGGGMGGFGGGDMGGFGGMGGGFDFGGNAGSGGSSDSGGSADSDSSAGSGSDSEASGAEGVSVSLSASSSQTESSAVTPSSDTQSEESASQTGGSLPEDFGPSQTSGSLPEGFDPSQAGGELPEGFDPSQAGGELPEGFDPSQADGELPEGFDPSQADGELPEGFGPSQGGSESQAEEDDSGETDTAQTEPDTVQSTSESSAESASAQITNESSAESDAAQTESGSSEDSGAAQTESGSSEDSGAAQGAGSLPEGFDPSQAGGELPEGFDFSQFGSASPGGTGSVNTARTTNLIRYGLCFLVILAALLFAALYRRKPKKR